MARVDYPIVLEELIKLAKSWISSDIKILAALKQVQTEAFQGIDKMDETITSSL